MKKESKMNNTKTKAGKFLKSLTAAALFSFLTSGAHAGPVTDGLEHYSSDLENQTIKIAETLGRTVVSISTVVTRRIRQDIFTKDEMMRRFFEEFFGEIPEGEVKKRGLGSGVIIDEDGYILTNEHVVAGADKISIKLYDGREYEAEVKGTDVRSDLAVIKINAENLPTAELGDATDIRIGQWVMAVGNPLGYAIEGAEPTVTVGVISALRRNLPVRGKRDRSYTSLIQTDAAINPGNSGGPLVDLNGKVIGINVSILTTTGGFQGLGFAISVERVKQVIERLMTGKEIFYGWLGVSVQDPDKDLREYFGLERKEGVIILRVFPDSPAEKAGLEVGDVILRVDGEKMEDSIDLVENISSREPGTAVEMTVKKDGEKKNVRLMLGKRPGDLAKTGRQKAGKKQPEFRGMTVSGITPALKKDYGLTEEEGVVVTEVEPGSPAEKAGIRESDIITHVGRKRIAGVDDFRKAVKRVRGAFLIKTLRGFTVIKEK
ncbi:MAG: Do family serine endopeptidase [Candidatus Omnitrophica bacterium]|nr:Do family serine endopeptidase [Candidatus Omnitrophota bacterium]